MKKYVSVLIAIYILSILAWSGLVRAEVVVLDKASFDNENLVLVLEGRTNNPCGISIQTEVIEDQSSHEKKDKVVFLEVVKNRNVDLCFTLATSRIFSKVIDVRSLGLGAGSYQLSLANYISNAEAKVDFLVNIPVNSYYPNYDSVELSGVLSQSENGEWILTAEQGRKTTLKTELDLSKYVGHNVFVEGTQILHRMGPGFEIAAHSPLRAKQVSEDPAVFLFTISTEMY